MLLVTLLSFFGCDIDIKNSKKSVPESIGSESNIIVVTDSSVWANGSKDIVSKIYEKNYPVLNQAEPYYKLLDIKFLEFNSLLKRSKVILFVADISRNSKLSRYIKNNIGENGIKKMNQKDGFFINFVKNEWASPQLIIVCAGADEEKLKNGLKKYEKILFEKVLAFEAGEMKKRYAIIKSKDKYKKIMKQKFDMDLKVPVDFNLSMEGDSFVCFSKEIESGYMCVSFYLSKYKDTTQFKSTNIIDRRDEVLGKHIQGELNNTYMITEKRVPLHEKVFYLDSSYSKQMRGLWRLENDFMGGPFINQTMYNKRKSQLIHVDGFVYAPGKSKKKYMKEIECLLSGIKI